MAAIEIKKGTYKWNDTITKLPTDNVYALDFESNLGDDAKYAFNRMQNNGNTHIQFCVASVNDDTTNSTVGTFIDVYNLSSNTWQWAIQEFTIATTATVDSEFGTWFNNNATAVSIETDPDEPETPDEPDTPTETATIKAGTYRFNDVLTYTEDINFNIELSGMLPGKPEISGNKVSINTMVPSSFTAFACIYEDNYFGCGYAFTASSNSFDVAYISDEYGWDYSYAVLSDTGIYEVDENVKGYGQIMTITSDTEVDAAFATWFEANAKPYTIPTEDSIIAKMKALIAKANVTTGKSDTDLTEAILSLAAGYGVAGGGIVEVTSEATMTAILNSATTANSGKLYKYVGPGGTYCLGALSGSSTISAVPGVDMNYGFSNGARSIEFVSVSDTGTVTKPSSLAVNTAYKMRLYKERASNTTNYFNGSITDEVLQTTTKPAEGANVYLEGVYDTDGSTIIGYRFYFMNGTDDTYIDVTTEGKIAFVIENPNAVYKQKTNPVCWYTTVGTYAKNAYYRLEVK